MRTVLMLALFTWSATLIAQQEEEPRKPAAALAVEAKLRECLAGPIEKLDLATVMLGEDFFGAEPTSVQWADGSGGLRFSWKRWDEARRRTWSYVLGEDAAKPWPEDRPAPPHGTFDRDRAWRVFVEGSTVEVENMATGEVSDIVQVAEAISSAVFDADTTAVLYRTKSGVYRVSLSRPALKQLLVFGDGVRKPEAKGEKKKRKEGLAGWHETIQEELFRILWERTRNKERSDEHAEARKKVFPEIPTYRAPKGFAIRGVVISPTATHVAVSLAATDGKKAKVADMPDYVTADGYTRSRPTRAKVGDVTGERRLEIVELATGDVVQVKEPSPDRKAWPSSPSWSADGRFLIASARADDDMDAWLLRVDPKTGDVSVLHHRHDPAWVNRSEVRARWLGDTSRVFFVSEATGWMHVWVADVAAETSRQLTHGSFEVRRPQATPGGERIYAIATPTSPHVADLVSIDAKTGAMTVLATDGGGRRFWLSPDGTKIAEVFSRANQPWELRIRDLDATAKPKVLTDSPSPAFKSRTWLTPEIVHVSASDGVKVPARIYRPARPRPGKPAVLFVHGAGYLQNVHQWWSSYYREYGFHHLLCEAGYTVLDVDYRGSAGYGRDWRTAIYGYMGGRDLSDYVDAAQWLVEKEGCGKDRIGIYGGSYGGFMALMGLFTSPGTFAAGAALRPVTDWAHYNDGYTSNILDDPLESPEHYRRSSPIHHAEGLQDHLLICHGVLDTNVHVQGVFRLQQRLIELRKHDWEVAYYPLEGHGFRDAASWYDEYRRIFELFERVIGRP
ncbi:MAG: S9 family peptidase [Planctomycetes bacterium]|nr:S9 family peptidase [Planctomycetota bacterium]